MIFVIDGRVEYFHDYRKPDRMLVADALLERLRAEHHVAVPPLPIPLLAPGAEAGSIDLIHLEKNPAVQLFVQRAQAVHPDFHLSPENARSCAEICVRLEGIPLALELAAPRLKLLSPQALLARLDRRLQVLTGGAWDLPDRQRTLRDTIAWSYDLLTSREQQLFRRLAAFVGGFTLPAVETMCQRLDEQEPMILDEMTSLLDKSLVQRTQTIPGEPHFQLLEMLHEFALERLSSHGEIAEVKWAHALYYLDLAEQAYSELSASHQERAWLERLDSESGNLSAAFIWLIEAGERGQSTEPALRLGGALERYWLPRGFGSIELELMTRALRHRAGASPAVQTQALFCAGNMARHIADLGRATAWAQEQLALCRQQQELRGAAWALHTLGWVALQHQDTGAATASFEEALALRRQIVDEEGIAWSLLDMASMVVVADGDADSAHAWLAESLSVFQKRDHQRGTARVLDALGSLELLQWDFPAARTHFEKALVHFQELGIRRGTWSCQASLAIITIYQGNLNTAEQYGQDALLTVKLLGAPGDDPFTRD